MRMKGHSFINYSELFFLPLFVVSAFKESLRSTTVPFLPMEVINFKKALLTLLSTDAISCLIGEKSQQKGRPSVPFNDCPESPHQTNAITSLHDKL